MDKKEEKQEDESIIKIGKASGAIIAGAGGAIAGTGAALTAAGFTTSGIAAGSIAASVQGVIGSVAAGSTFATVQSLGATGVLSAAGPIGLGILVIGGLIGGGVFLFKKLTSKKQEQKKEGEEKKEEEEEDNNNNLQVSDIIDNDQIEEKAQKQDSEPMRLVRVDNNQID